MTRIAHLLLAACALTAVSPATLPQTQLAPETPIKDIQEGSKPIEVIKEDSLVPSPAEDIPVAVVVEDSQPLDNLNEVSDDEEIKRPQADLRNPGEPQRQEHETQNPEYFLEEAAKLFSLKENIDQAQLMLKQGFEGVSEDIQNWISNNEQLNNIQQNIRNLRQTFSSQIQKLNESLQGFVKPEPSSEESQVKRDFKNIESRIQSLQENFNSGLNTLTEGVRIIASVRSQQVESLRQSSEGAAAPEAPAQPAQPAQPAAPAPANPPQNILVQYADMVSTSVSQGFNNVTQAIGQYFTNNNPITGIQNLLNPTTSTGAPGVLADTPEGAATPRPNPWQNLQGYFSNFFSGGQGQASQTAGQTQPASGQGPFAGLQNLPIFQNVVQLIRPGATTTTTVKPAESGQSAEASAPAATGSNNAPDQSAAEPQNDKPAETATLPPTPVGPIRQILNSIPVVQRIQNTLTNSGNPEKPREPVGGVKSNTQVKGGLFPKPPPPHPHGSSGDNNNNDDSGVKVKENEPEITKENPKTEVEESKKPQEKPELEESIIPEEIKPQKPSEITKTE